MKYILKKKRLREVKLMMSIISKILVKQPGASFHLFMSQGRINSLLITTNTNLQSKKIKNIQKIIWEENKSKPCLNMTMKRPSRKQIIVPMNNENKSQFIKDSSSHIANINRVLKSIKSEIIANFVRVENSGIVITTNKVAAPLNLQMIE